MRQKLINLAAQRTAALDAAQAAALAGNQSEMNSQMEIVNNLNSEINSVQNLLNEQQRQIIMTQPSEAEVRDAAEERFNALRNGREIKFSVDEMMRGAFNSTVVAGTIAQPAGAGASVRDNLGASSLLDLVSVQDMSGLGSWEEPYTSADQSTYVGVPTSTGGTARTAADPTYAVSVIKPYEVAVTSFVDKNIARLSPTAYMEKIQQQAYRALRNKVAYLCLLGDSEASHVMYGMINGTNKAGTSIIDTVNATVSSSKGKVDEDLLQNMYFAYGNTYECGQNARLFCNKTDLAAWGKLRGTNEKRHLFDITPEMGMANRGVIADGGFLVPYILDPNLTAVDGTAQAASTGADKFCCIYGDPANYLLGLFGDYTIRVDESVKAVERMFAILGDVVVGGNVIVNKGFVVAKIPKAAQ